MSGLASLCRRGPGFASWCGGKVGALVMTLLCLTPGLAAAQNAPPRPSPADVRRPWFVVGGGSTTLLGDCTDCEADTYLHSAGVLANAGVSLNRRTDIGAEILWLPETLSTGDQIRVTFLMAAVQFRPWETHGFFIKAGSGMAFLRNWLDAFEQTSPPIRSKAFALGLGAGWEWRTGGPFGVQVFGAQHVAALGDLETSERTAENVMGNFWFLGAGIAIH